MVIKYCKDAELETCIGQKRIICFGASDMATEYVQEGVLSKQIDFFIDNNWNLKGKYICTNTYKWEIYDFDKLHDIDGKKYVMLIFSNSYRDIIHQCSKLNNLKEMEVYVYPLVNKEFWEKFEVATWKWERMDSAVLNVYKEMLSRVYHYPENQCESLVEAKKIQLAEQDRFVVPKVNFLVTTHCTLRCKDCIGLIPYMSPCHMKIENVIFDIQKFVDVIDECVVAEIGGGEPFLYPHLEHVLEYMINEPKITYIRIPTNGTIVPNDNITKLLRNEKVSLYISYYGFDEITNRFLQYVKQNKIAYLFEKEMLWIDAGNLKKRNKSPVQKLVEYYLCNAGKMCKTICSGRLYHCARAARMCFMDEAFKEDSLDLVRNDLTEENRKRVREFFLAKCSMACDYCDLAKVDTKIIKPGLQLKGGCSRDVNFH